MPVAGAATIPPITKDYPDFAKFLPWGPFYGVCVKRDTPDDVKATLVKAFKTAGDNAQFQTLMKERGNVMMNVSGAEADAFLKKWQSVTAWVLQDVGAPPRSHPKSSDTAAVVVSPEPGTVGLRPLHQPAFPGDTLMDSSHRRLPGELVFVLIMLLLALVALWQAWRIAGFSTWSSPARCRCSPPS